MFDSANTPAPYSIGSYVFAPVLGFERKCIVIDRSDSAVGGWMLVKAIQGLDDYPAVKVSSNDVRNAQPRKYPGLG